MQCGAKTLGGKACKARPMTNGKCRLHGGKSTGAKRAQRPGNKNALIHGVYSRVITPEEEPFLPQIRKQIGHLDSELVVARIQLDRALQAQKKVLENPDDHNLLGLAEIKAEKNSITTIHRAPDWWAIIDRLLGRICRLEVQNFGLRLAEVEELKMQVDEMIKDLRDA